MKLETFNYTNISIMIKQSFGVMLDNLNDPHIGAIYRSVYVFNFIITSFNNNPPKQLGY